MHAEHQYQPSCLETPFNVPSRSMHTSATCDFLWFVRGLSLSQSQDEWATYVLKGRHGIPSWSPETCTWIDFGGAARTNNSGPCLVVPLQGKLILKGPDAHFCGGGYPHTKRPRTPRVLHMADPTHELAKQATAPSASSCTDRNSENWSECNEKPLQILIYWSPHSITISEKFMCRRGLPGLKVLSYTY